jgi:hypothetical protein
VVFNNLILSQGYLHQLSEFEETSTKMASSPAVPPEVLALIVSLAELETLKSLRLTSRMLCHFASKDLFRVVTLYDTEESCHGFKSIISHPQLKYHVAKVYLKTVENGGVSATEMTSLTPY